LSHFVLLCGEIEGACASEVSEPGKLHCIRPAEAVQCIVGYKNPLYMLTEVDIVIYDIASKQKAELAEPLVQQYRYVVNRWISFNWRYPLFDVAIRYDLIAMGRRAMNHCRGLYKEMAPLDQEIRKLATRLRELMDKDKSGNTEYPDFAASALDLGFTVTDAEFQALLETVSPSCDHLQLKAFCGMEERKRRKKQ
jgi:hypothetical protein